MKSYLVTVRLTAGQYKDSVRHLTETGENPQEAARSAEARANREYPGSQPMISGIQLCK